MMNIYIYDHIEIYIFSYLYKFECKKIKFEERCVCVCAYYFNMVYLFEYALVYSSIYKYKPAYVKIK